MRDDNNGLNELVTPGSLVLETRPRSRPKNAALSTDRQLELLSAAEIIRNDPAGPHNDSLSFMANILVRLTMPHKQIRDRNGNIAHVFHREYDGRSITIQAHPKIGLPTGAIPRLLMSFITTEAVRTKQPLIELGGTLSEFLRRLGYTSFSGGPRGTGTAVRQQLQRLFSSHISILDTRDDNFAISSVLVAKRALLWWDQKDTDQVVGHFRSTVELSRDFFDEIIRNPVPLDMRALALLGNSPMCLDIYAYLTWHMSWLKRAESIRWTRLQAQFGAGYPETSAGLRDFRTAFRLHLKKVLTVYPEARIDVDDPTFCVLRPSPTHVPMLDSRKAIGRIAQDLKSER